MKRGRFTDIEHDNSNENQCVIAAAEFMCRNSKWQGYFPAGDLRNLVIHG